MSKLDSVFLTIYFIAQAAFLWISGFSFARLVWMSSGLQAGYKSVYLIQGIGNLIFAIIAWILIYRDLRKMRHSAAG